MSEQTPYQRLEVSEDASFEEIQSARDRLVKSYTDEQAKQDVEMAYDAILMDRLRRRQTGEMDVPERIRFAEKLAEKKPSFSLPAMDGSPEWIQRLLDQPSGREVMITSGVWLLLGAFAIAAQTGPDINANQQTLSFLMAIGIGFNVFWLQRKELKLWRAVSITLVTLLAGSLLAIGLLQLPLAWGGVDPNAIIALVVFTFFWGASSFLR